jgi:small subunit ribosomal protein S9
MAETRYYATGKRKNAVARVWLTHRSSAQSGGQGGEGSENESGVVINGKTPLAYLCRRTLEALIHQPFEVTKTVGQYTVMAKAHGGGISGQAGAVRHGISKALIEAEPELRPVLRRGGYLTRDPRVKERKKYGRKRARRGFQFSKR